MCLQSCFCPVRLFATLWTVTCQAPLSSISSWSLLKFMFNESIMISNHIILSRPLLLLPSMFPSIGIFSKELETCTTIHKFIDILVSVNYILIKISYMFPYHITEIKADFSNSRCHFPTLRSERENQSFSKFHFLVIEIMCLTDSLIHRNCNTVSKK